MYVSLNSEVVADVKFDHEYTETMEGNKLVKRPYKTICNVNLFTSNKEHYEMISGEAVCVANDNFCRLVGRKIAFGRVLKQIRDQNLLTKEERAKLFFHAFPKYASSEVMKSTNVECKTWPRIKETPVSWWEKVMGWFSGL